MDLGKSKEIILDLEHFRTVAFGLQVFSYIATRLLDLGFSHRFDKWTWQLYRVNITSAVRQHDQGH